MDDFAPCLGILPPPQARLWPELDAIPEMFTLYGGTALALRLGHRSSIDFDFFANDPFEPVQLARSLPFLRQAETVLVGPNTLTCRVDRGGGVLVSFFGGLGLGRIAPPQTARGRMIKVASLLDLAGTKAAVTPLRAESKDYLDIYALLGQGLDLPTMLAAGRIIHGRSFNPLLTLKALSYFDDLPDLPAGVRARLTAAVAAVDPDRLPLLTPDHPRPEHGDATP